MFDITKVRALETAQIDLVRGDGSPLYDDEGNQLSVTVHGPGSKLWQQADAERNRKRTARIEKNRGKITAALDNAREDEIDFLTAVTVSFNGWTYPGEYALPRDMFRAAYTDDTIGFIRDHVHKEATDWTVFTKGSATS
jgi:hypothetical protein